MDRPTLRELWANHTGRLIDRWDHYLDIYPRYFERFRDKHVRVLEIGVCHGGSLQLWKAYFGYDAEITGLDINPQCKEYEDAQIKVVIGNQANPHFMAKFAEEHGPWDIVIDDGSHVTEHQETSFRALWPHTTAFYICEDCHTRYPQLEAGLIHQYPWVIVAEKLHVEPKRIVTGKPSRELNGDEKAVYGAINAVYRDPNP